MDIVDFIERSARAPEWDKATKVHDWRNHVPGHIQSMWRTFTIKQRMALVEWAEAMASAEGFCPSASKVPS